MTVSEYPRLLSSCRRFGVPLTEVLELEVRSCGIRFKYNRCIRLQHPQGRMPNAFCILFEYKYGVPRVLLSSEATLSSVR